MLRLLLHSLHHRVGHLTRVDVKDVLLSQSLSVLKATVSIALDVIDPLLVWILCSARELVDLTDEVG